MGVKSIYFLEIDKVCSAMKGFLITLGSHLAHATPQGRHTYLNKLRNSNYLHIHNSIPTFVLLKKSSYNLS